MLPNKNIKIFLNYWLGPLIFIWLSWSIYRQLSQQPNLANTWEQMQRTLQTEHAWKLMAAIGLMVFNWGLEAIKWRELLLPLHRISYWRAFKATLAGLAFAVNTPNRIGEYGGRVLYLPEGKRLASISLTLIGSFSQVLVTMIAGTIALWIWYANYKAIDLPSDWDLQEIWVPALGWLVSILTGCGILLYLRISWIVRWVEKIPGANKLLHVLQVVDHLPVTILLRVLGWSLLRYLVFVIQYILLLQCFGVTELIGVAAWMISLQFLIMAIIPTIALADIGIRGKLALELFGMISANQLGIIAAALGIWLINLVGPAILGSLLIIRIKLVKANPVKEMK
ncbi:lysylphosphatidylglycerol synthase transmembrane domain-containing protein [Flavihumibacter sp. UBA7668]|uniref:lysylphosphatidylglycerol synthase transmembrane domain-containing protein n=1 Tax=Flavihumibacter sp. UBA7668 TaxID=1946542 RepID=UPI0025C7309D|nr:lysylphosphatidylglycerol synthase transmembrane domain-containing protein [Flavihumibacter sp. UBA7668]